jgi:SAM-dependent methyltransferase
VTHDVGTQARAANRDLWDKRVRAHLSHGLYPSAAVESGTYDLGEPDITDVGDVHGLTLIHLQCNAGADTLAWAGRGAEVTGVDFSSEAITEARRLAGVAGVDATFLCADVYDLAGAGVGPFDVVYTSMGVLWWLPDLDRWAEVVAALVVEGGRFYLFEIHPAAMAVVDRDGRFEIGEDYFGPGEPIVFETTGTYYDAPGFEAEPATEHGTVHTLGSVVTALSRAGLTIDFLHEHPFTRFRMHPSLERDERGYWRRPVGEPRIPLTFSLLASKRPARTAI